MENLGITPIHWPQLVLAFGLILFTLMLSWLYELGLTRSITVAAARCYFQLLILGYALLFVFTRESVVLTLLILVVMIFGAAHSICARLKKFPYRLYGPALAAAGVTGLVITFLVTGLIIGVSPWYRAMVVIPIAGMVFGNSMNGIALTMERVFSDLTLRHEEVKVLIALGATPREAARPSLCAAFSAGLIPTINNLSAVGIVSIPGMMTGQILAGADPVMASHYQIVVMLMVASAVALGSLLAVLLSYRLAFNALGAPRE